MNKSFREFNERATRLAGIKESKNQRLLKKCLKEN